MSRFRREERELEWKAPLLVRGTWPIDEVELISGGLWASGWREIGAAGQHVGMRHFGPCKADRAGTWPCWNAAKIFRKMATGEGKDAEWADRCPGVT